MMSFISPLPLLPLVQRTLKILFALNSTVPPKESFPTPHLLVAPKVLPS